MHTRTAIPRRTVEENVMEGKRVMDKEKWAKGSHAGVKQTLKINIVKVMKENVNKIEENVERRKIIKNKEKWATESHMRVKRKKMRA